jgi:sulfite reductase (NADPH) flavoprotein alpha-component
MHLLGGRTLRQVLTEDLSLGAPPDALFDLIACITGGERRQKARRLAKGEDPDGDAATLDVLAALRKFQGMRLDPEAFVESLDPLQPRLYSIASSPLAEPGRVALTVDHVRYREGGRMRHGVASSWLAERAPLGQRLKGYVQRADHFRLPQDGAAPIIMVVPGTGIAPFRAFLQERAATGAKGPAWLFFGHRRAATDFFYREELEGFLNDGVLSRFSPAWSRDGEGRTYVQDRMLAFGEELCDWLYDGAHFYVCGDAARMAVQVEQTLAEIISDFGNRDDEAAQAYIEKMKTSGRYQTDVY